MKKEQSKKRSKSLYWVIGILFLVVVFSGVYLYSVIFKPVQLNETVYVYIDSQTNYEAVVRQLKEKKALSSERIFDLLARQMKYPQAVKTGRYAVTDGMNILDVLRTLRSGKQAPVNLTFNNIRTKENLAGRLSQQLMADSLSILDVLEDEEKALSFGFNEYTFVAMFLPNTYEVYWDTSVDRLFERMHREYTVFWNDERRNKASAIGLSPVEVSTLASIVEEEATFADEYPVVAGLYLNRLNKGMRLEADPTVKFAVGDFSLRRILYRHLEIESPYNTYKHTGLPPGPIRVPSIQAIEAVLSPQQHSYLFMCAKDDLSGRHNFAVTHAEHARNAARYQRALNERGIF
ncbi:endolytic transglycosylase MltG [Limibacterium fermenti]|uniref:endolytic transglycosylase MltG n=2 Tax=Dysgonomonadaceae TaxID=2005520 RepID=UPI000E8C8B8A|nr:endolytic transglycosylase MltG [Porphyromonadaceae bacterium]